MENKFPDEEIRRTGADPSDIDAGLLRALNAVRHEIGVPFHLLRNGLTTGGHSSPMHKAGKAADFTVRGCDAALAYRVAITAASHGFRGIGVYRNFAGAFSFHLDLREGSIAVWYGIKGAADNEWIMLPPAIGRAV
jgi:hypothetical protein